jgi:formate dehydrogenase maturation protein FdhE
MTDVSLTTTVPVAAAIQRVTNPHRVPERKCPVCGLKPPAGVVRHKECR